MAEYAIELLAPTIHCRNNFDCGVEPLNAYLRERACQDMRRHASNCWVLIEKPSTESILGYYTLSPEGIENEALPELEPALRKKFPTYERLGAVLLGRLAVRQDYQGRGIGEHLLFDAFHRALKNEIPSVLMVTDPQNKKAEDFYKKYGFDRLNAERLFIPMATISKRVSGRINIADN